ncbi:MAG: hypothetical protein ACI4NM_06330 [Bullifex sp.]
MNIGAPEILYNGRKLVTITEFAKRKGVTRYAINYHIKNGNLRCIKPNGYNVQYMDWEDQSLAYDSLPTRIKVRKKEQNSFMKEIKKPKITTPKLEGVEPVVLPSSDIKTEKIEDVSYINPDDHPDCWYFDGGEPVVNPVTGQKQLDYDRLKLKLVSQKYQFDFEKDRGKYIAKEDVLRTAQGMSKIISAYLESIPQRYGSILIAQVTRMTGHEFTPEETSEIRNTLVNSGVNTLESIRNEFMKLVEDDGE